MRQPPTLGLRAYGEPLGEVQVAAFPEDFLVDECLGFRPTADGPHVLVRIEKRGLSTSEAVRRLARHWAVPARAIGHAGRKDRAGVTRQWLSVPWSVHSALPRTGAMDDQLQLLEIQRHRRKLRVGAHRGNRFRLLIRGVEAPHGTVNARLARIARQGVPNYFGPQRFGRDGDNLDRAIRWLLQGGDAPRNRTDRGMLLSALRSEAFNRVLATRLADGDWWQARADDLLVLDGRGSLFPAEREAPSRRARRIAGLAIHPTGPLPGRARSGLCLPATLQAREAMALSDLAAAPEALAGIGVEADRRPLRLAAGGLTWSWPAADRLMLHFSLPPGGFATTVLRELFRWSAP